MGAAYTPEEWDAWTERMKSAHGNGNGHGKSLSIEAQRLLSTPQARDYKGLPADGFNQACLVRDVALLPTPGVAGGGKCIPEDAEWSGNAAYKPDGTKVQVHLDWIAENRLLPTPTSSVDSGGLDENGEKYGPTSGVTLTDAAIRQDWREYEAAIRRHEHATGRTAPPPTETGAKGKPRLSPRFVEWLMGLPEGWVTDVPGISRNDQLKALGNGVVPAQCAAALRAFIHDTREAVA